MVNKNHTTDNKPTFKNCFRNVVVLIMLFSLVSGLCGCGGLKFGDRDSKNAYELALKLSEAIGDNDEKALRDMFSEQTCESLHDENLAQLSNKYSFTVEDIEDWFINTSQSDVSNRYETTAGFYITDKEGNEYEMIFKYVSTDNDDKNVGLLSIAFATKAYFEKNEYTLPPQYDNILVPPEGEDE